MCDSTGVLPIIGDKSRSHTIAGAHSFPFIIAMAVVIVRRMASCRARASNEIICMNREVYMRAFYMLDASLRTRTAQASFVYTFILVFARFSHRYRCKLREKNLLGRFVGSVTCLSNLFTHLIRFCVYFLYYICLNELRLVNVPYQQMMDD